MPDVTLAIHGSRSGFNPHWIDYCRREKIPHKVVNCYDNDIVEQLRDCSALLWHHSHSDPRDVLIARQIIFAHEHSGFKVFPDFRQSWHFDDKLGQKYLFEALDLPRLRSYAFVEAAPALEWARTTDYPKVFKLRHGAASSCVRLVRSKHQARSLIKRAFGRGFTVYSPWQNLKERFYKAKLGASDSVDVAKGFGRFLYPPRFSRVLGRQRGYVLFQDFAPGNDSDVRIVVIGDKAFGLRRWVRPGDFRASGSLLCSTEREQIDVEYVALAFKLADRIGGQCLAFDLIRTEDNSLAVIEVSYGFKWKGKGSGYWDRNLKWCEGKFRPEEWMVDLVLDSLTERPKVVSFARPQSLLTRQSTRMPGFPKAVNLMGDGE